MPKTILRLLALHSSLGIIALSHADLAYSNLGLGDAFDTDRAWAVSTATSLVGYQSLAQAFVSASSGELTTIELAGAYYDGSGSLQASLFSDAAGSVGTAIETFSVDLSSTNESGSLFTLTSAGGVLLDAGRQYWIGVVAQDDSWLGWSYAAPATSGTLSINFDSPSGTTSVDRLGALRITTQAVPEPGSAAVLGLGGLAWLRRRVRLAR